VPLLRNHVPKQNENLRAKIIMKTDPITLTVVPTVKEISEALLCGYKSFPVMNNSNQLIGTISSNFLVILIEN
jgi:predicted transcriptional regulator